VSGTLALALLLATSLVTGCSSKLTDPGPATIEPAGAAASPPPGRPPVGEVLALGGRPTAALFDAATSSLVVFTPGTDPTPGSLTIVGPTGAARPVVLPAGATAIAGDGDGAVYATIRGGFVTVDLATGRLTETAIDGHSTTDFTALARRADGRLLVGSAAGAVYVLADQTGSNQTGSDQTGSDQTGSIQTGVTAETTIFSRVDAIVTEGETAVVLDRGQTSVTALNQQGTAKQALRAGLGATTIAADPAGRVLVTDTRGGQLLVFSVDPLIQRQGYPIGESPYAIAGSKTLVWVSQTGINSVAGYDLGSGIPVEKVRYPTVRQPNSLAFDEVSGTLYVVSGSGDGIQVIRNAAGTP
jgi:sugar lactone lactonase YvrE